MIYPRESEGILRAVLIEIGIVDAHAPINFIFLVQEQGLPATLDAVLL